MAEDMPTVTFRAEDRLLPQLLMVYGQISKHGGCTDERLAEIRQTQDDVVAWQNAHPDRVGLQ